MVIDVGNTNTVLGVFRGEELVCHWRITTQVDRTVDEFSVVLKELFSLEGLSLGEVEGVSISSVVPPVTPILEEVSRRIFRVRPLVVGPGVKTGMPILYENPAEVGADRIVNAVAAYETYRRELIVVDFGTATTFDYVSARGEYLGGAIAPGITISMEALFQRASKLPKVEFTKPKGVIGRNTVWSMQAGVFFGYVGMVEAIVKRMASERRSHPFVVATGGLAPLIAAETAAIDAVDEFLTLKGLRIIYERNSGVVRSGPSRPR